MYNRSICFLLIMAFSLILPLTTLQAQPVRQYMPAIRDSIYKIMLDFPNQFQSLREGRGVNSGEYISKVWIPTVDYCIVKQDQSNYKWDWRGTISDSGDEPDEDEMERLFKEWKLMLDMMDIAGIRLVPYKTNRYTTENKNKFYEEGYAWRLDNSRNNIDPRFQMFTIRLECVRHSEDHLEVRLLISDN